MTTTDKLTDEQWLIQHLEDDAEACSAVNGSKDITTKDARRAEVTVKRLIRERDDARRASQAAPAQPTEAMLNAARDWSDAKYGKPIGNDAAIGCWNAMLAAAPTPSDGLREAAQTLLDGAETGSLAALHHAVSDMFGVVDGSDKEDELFEALLEGLRHTGTRAALAKIAQEG